MREVAIVLVRDEAPYRKPDVPVALEEDLLLVPLTAAHADALYPLFADAEVWKFTAEQPPEELEVLRERCRRLERRTSPDGAELWLNWALESARLGVIGVVQATVAENREDAAIAYVLGRSYWGRGLGTQAVRALLALLHVRMSISLARATVDERNVASMRMLRTLGFAIVDATDPRNVRFERILA